MRENRETLLFIVCACVLGLLTWLKLDGAYVSERAPDVATYPARELQRPPRVLLAGAEASVDAGDARKRSAFEPPRELLPLDPLSLPDPPVPALAVRRPSVQPALGGAAARRYRMAADELGSLDLSTAAGDDFDASADFDEGAGAGFSRGPAADASFEALVDADEAYDWIVRGAGSSRLYGRLLNDDPHGLTSRLGEDLRFQQITLRTGRNLGLPFDVPRTDVTEFGLARTFENEYILRSRALGSGAGAVAGRTKLALDMLAAASDQERALEFAEREARKALEHSPSDPFTARLLGAILAEAHDVEGQLAVYRAAVERKALSAPLLADYAGLVGAQGLVERAEELLDEADGQSRLAAEVHYQRGQLLRGRGDDLRALEAFKAAEQGSFSAPFEARQDSQLALATGETLLSLGRVDEARRTAERLLVAEPRDAGALALLGGCHAAADEWLDAAEAYAAALLVRPDDGRLLTSAGLVAWKLGDGGEALRLCAQALRLDPYHGRAALEAMGFLHEDGGEGQVARDLYAQALRLEPDEPELLYRLGRVQRLDGDYEGAQTTLRRALRLGGPDVLLLSELGRVAIGRARFGAATGYFREALRLESDSADLLWLLGLSQLLDGDLLTAVESLQAASRQGAAGAHAALGVAQYRLGNAQQALDQFDEVGRALAGKDDDVMVRFAAEQAAAIRDNLSKRQWVDSFGRRTLQRGWTERQWDGSPRVFLGPDLLLHIEGRMEKPRDDERPGVARTVEGRTFVAAEVTLSAAGGGDSRYGLVLTHKQVKGVLGQLPKARLEIWVDSSGQVRLSALDNFETVVLDGLALPGLRVPPGSAVTLGIELLDASTGTFGFQVDDRVVGEPVTLKALRSMASIPLHLDVFADAPPGRGCDVDVTRVRIVQFP